MINSILYSLILSLIILLGIFSIYNFLGINLLLEKIISFSIASKLIFGVCILFLGAMFLYSGVDKASNFDSKLSKLQAKLPNLSSDITKLGLGLVTILEILLPIILVFVFLQIFFTGKVSPLLLSLNNFLLLALLIFLIVVTYIYHPPSTNKMIPFLSNVCTFGGILLLLLILNMNKTIPPQKVSSMSNVMPIMSKIGGVGAPVA